MQKPDQKTQEKIEQLQILEQSLQNFLLQKQAFQFELTETESALEELKKSKDEVYKLVGQVMIKASKENIEKDLLQKKDILNLRIKSIEKQDSQLKQEVEKIREEVLKNIK